MENSTKCTFASKFCPHFISWPTYNVLESGIAMSGILYHLHYMLICYIICCEVRGLGYPLWLFTMIVIWISVSRLVGMMVGFLFWLCLDDFVFSQEVLRKAKLTDCWCAGGPSQALHTWFLRAILFSHLSFSRIRVASTWLKFVSFFSN